MKYDQYEIKNVKHMKSMSEETECFSLDLYVAGKKFAHVANRGQGGCHDVHPYSPFTWADVKRVTEEMKDDKFLVDFDFEEFDTGVSTLLSMWMVAKDITKGSKTKAVYLVGENIMEMGYKDKTLPPDQKLFDRIKEKHPEAIILNGMDSAEAAKLAIIAARPESHEAESTLELPDNFIVLKR